MDKKQKPLKNLSLKKALEYDALLNKTIGSIGVEFCIRCFRGERKNFRKFHRSNTGSLGLATDRKIDTKKWFKDIEHGFFHGFCTVLAAHLIDNPKRTNGLDTASFLYHDLSKSLTGEGYEHDLALKAYKGGLAESVYNHSLPSKEEEESLIVRADRLELLRYKDWREWVDLDKVVDLPNPLFEYFYSIFRPAMSSFYENKNELWVRHGPDSNFKGISYNTKFPHQNACNFKNEDGKDAWPIEIDKLPFNYCSQHGLERSGFKHIRGYMPLKELKKQGGVIEVINRDHLAYSSEKDFSVKNWLFIIKQRAVEEKPFFIEGLIRDGALFLMEDTFEKAWKLINLLEFRVEALNGETP